jgi:hypothetical protein
MNDAKRILVAAIMLVVGLSFLVGVSTVTTARTIQVPGEYRTLQQAINAARSGDKIVLTSTRTLRENIELRNDRRLTITTSSRTRQVTINGSRRDEPVITLTNCSSITFENIIIQSGSVGVFSQNSKDIVFTDCTIEKNRTAGLQGTGFTLEDCVVERNGTWGVELIGDPTDPSKMEAMIETSTIAYNRQGGVSVRAATLEIKSSTIEKNLGYGLDVSDKAVVTFNDTIRPTVISENKDGGIFVHGATLTVQGIVRDNKGPGILAESATLDLDEATISGNPEGGVIYRESTGTINASQIIDNDDDGVVLELESTVAFSGSTISGQSGRGIYVTGGSDVRLTEETIVTGNGTNGLVIDAATGTVSNSTITSNTENGMMGLRSMERQQTS